jgi:hypothetical protein
MIYARNAISIYNFIRKALERSTKKKIQFSHLKLLMEIPWNFDIFHERFIVDIENLRVCRVFLCVGLTLYLFLRHDFLFRLSHGQENVFCYLCIPKHPLKLGDKVVFLTDSSSPFKLLFYSSEALKMLGATQKRMKMNILFKRNLCV